MAIEWSNTGIIVHIPNFNGFIRTPADKSPISYLSWTQETSYMGIECSDPGIIILTPNFNIIILTPA